MKKCRKLFEFLYEVSTVSEDLVSQVICHCGSTVLHEG